MKVIFGAWTPSLIIDFINNGVDMFDTSFPYLTTERKSALIFDYNLKYKWDFLTYSFIYLQCLKHIIEMCCDVYIITIYRNDSIIIDFPRSETNENIEKLNYEICLADKW